ncbi:uncharacterized protein [Rutidosis leptorrhynchoides]|uniref:uncharacterized protein n=1 Tax=Rutidosis leptorrhynchoides TaxID=125765 RepID=UPI003A98FE7A
MISVQSAWPFSKWGIDLVGPLTEALGGYKWLVVAIDYFTKWTEAKPLSITKGKHIEKFVWEHIVCRFGIPQEIVSDNGKQFAEGIFPGFCEKLQIKQTFTSVYHPQGNVQVEVTNREILKGLEKRLADIQVLTNRIVNLEENEENLLLNLELMEERREVALIREASYKKTIEKYYNKRVKPSVYKVRDYVLRLNSTSKVEYEGKMGPTWEGPYIISEAFGNGSYKLETMEGKQIPGNWNGVNLQKFYY